MPDAQPLSFQTGAGSQAAPLRITFRRGGNSRLYRGTGWSFEELDRTWTVGPSSSLRLPNKWPGETLILELDVAPFISLPLLQAQIFRVLIGEHLVASCYLTNRVTLKIELPAAAIGTRDIIPVSFEHPGYISPSMLRRSPDLRQIAINFRSIQLYRASQNPFDNLPDTTADGIPIHILKLRPLSVDDNPTTRPDSAARSPSKSIFYGIDRPSPAMAFLGQGWAIGQDGPSQIWTNAPCSQIDLPAPTKAGPHLLLLHVIPLVSDTLPEQEFTLFLRGAMLGWFRVSGEAILTIPIPDELIDGEDKLSLTFDLPLASRPVDVGIGRDRRLLALRLIHVEIQPVPPRSTWVANTRRDDSSPIVPLANSERFLDEPAESLSLALEASLGIDRSDLLRNFESLGNNCEFGMVARKSGVELLHLFRFGSIRLSGLLRGLAEDFSALDDPSLVALRISDAVRPEYLLEIEQYACRWHTFKYTDEIARDEALHMLLRQYKYLRQKFLAGLRSSRKIYVVKREPLLSFSEALALSLALNKDGRNWLLYVGLCDDGRRSGSVDIVAPGLMRGHIAAFAPRDNVGASTDPTDWLRLLGNAWLLSRAHGAP